MPFKITLGETACKRHPEADLWIDNWLQDWYLEHLGSSAELLCDPNEVTLDTKLDAIEASEVEVITTLQGRYSLGMIGRVVNRLRNRGVSVRIVIETLPENIRRGARAPDIEYHAAMDTSSPTEKPLNVFLCHCAADKVLVRDLYKFLADLGASVWFDEVDLIPGQDWNAEIHRAIRRSDLVIVCLSSRAVNKVGYLQKEIRLALDFADEQPDGTIYIVPAKLEQCEVPPRLNRWQWVNLFDEGGKDRLAQTLHARTVELRNRRANQNTERQS